MIRANCRERFTAADFDFVVRTLARSRIDHVSLVELLGDAETRDSVLDNPRLVDAILSNADQLCISSHFYFYVLARHVLRDVGIGSPSISPRTHLVCFGEENQSTGSLVLADLPGSPAHC